MISFNGTDAMTALIQRKLPQTGGLSTVRFTQNVGVSPGTTTLCLGCRTGMSNPLAGATPCPPDPRYPYMTERSPSLRPRVPASAAAETVTFEPYGNETSMNGAALGASPLGPSWLHIGLFTVGAALLGVGVAVARSRP